MQTNTKATYRERAKAIKAELNQLVELVKTEDRDFTVDEAVHVDQMAAEAEQLNEKAAHAERAKAVIDRLAAAPSSPEAARKGRSWGTAVTEHMREVSGAAGLKSLINGQIDTPPAVEVAALPDTPTRLLDLVAAEQLSSNTFSYLRQTVATNAADVVADGDTKPVSTYTFEEIEGRARVVAHMSEPFPLRYLDDYSSMIQVLDSQMRSGVLTKLEQQLVEGDGTGEQFTGLLTTTGVTDVAFAGDVISTLRRAVTTLQSLGETPNAFVLNPLDAEELSLTREDGATGAYLFTNDYASAAVFGGVGTRVVSNAVPQGTALLADWSQVRLGVREGEHTLAATQSGDLFETNRTKVRAEGRYGLSVLRPQAVAVVALAE